MQKKVKLTVMALFIVATALAQTEQPKQTEAQEDVVSEEAFTFTVG